MAPRPLPEPEQTSWKVLVFSGLASMTLIIGSLFLLTLDLDSNTSIETVSPPVAEPTEAPTPRPTQAAAVSTAAIESDDSESDDSESASAATDATDDPDDGTDDGTDDDTPAPEPTTRPTRVAPTPTPRATSTPRPSVEPTAEPTPDNGAQSLAELAAQLLGDRSEQAADVPAPVPVVTSIPALPRVIPSGQSNRPPATPIPRRPTAVPTRPTTVPSAPSTPQTSQASRTLSGPALGQQSTAPQPAVQSNGVPVPTPFEYVYGNGTNARGGRTVIACNVGSVYIDLNFDGVADGYLNSPCDYCPSGSLPSDRNGDGMLDC